MGIKKFYQFINKRAPKAVSLHPDLKSVFEGHEPANSTHKVAIDASNIMYKFLASTQHLRKGTRKNRIPKSKRTLTQPTSKRLGINTGHVMGIIYKSLNMLESGVTPVWVFDGEPLNLKNEEIQQRLNLKQFN